MIDLKATCLAATLVAAVSIAPAAADRTGCSEFLAAVEVEDAVRERFELFSRKHPLAKSYSPSERKAQWDRRLRLGRVVMEAADRTNAVAEAMESNVSDETTKRLLSALRDHASSAYRLQLRLNGWLEEKDAVASSPELSSQSHFPTRYSMIYIDVLKKACALGLVESGKSE